VLGEGGGDLPMKIPHRFGILCRTALY